MTYSDKVHLEGLPELGALDELVSEVKDKEEWNVDIWKVQNASARAQLSQCTQLTSCEEPRSIEAEEDLETIDQDEEHSPTSTPDWYVWLESIVIGILRHVVSLCDHSLA